MYYRSDMALELAQCSTFSTVWNAHPEWWLKDDKGIPVKEHGSTPMMVTREPLAQADRRPSSCNRLHPGYLFRPAISTTSWLRE